MVELKPVDGGETRNIREVPFPERMLMLYERVRLMEKGGHNKHFDYKFLGEADVKYAVNKGCCELGLYIYSTDVQMTPDSTGKAAVCKVHVVLADAYAGKETAQCVSLSGVGAGTDSSDKAPMKAFAVAWKYTFTGGLAISTGDDPEASGNDERMLADLRDRINTAMDVNALNLLKPEVSEWRESNEFGALKALHKARLAAVKGAE